MNFFERQRTARSRSVLLVALFTVAVLSTVGIVDLLAAVLMSGRSGFWPALVAASIGTLLVIGGGMLGKTVALRTGGAAVAASVGAVPVDPTTTDPALHRLVNVVEEMSIASGVPMPRLFVMPREPGINAFAAGFTAADAAITLTEGAVSQLTRDELQGVIGHEFSHILNGDTRLNIRLIVLLHGIMLLSLIGSRFLAVGGRGSGRKNALPIAAIALVVMVVGYVGQFLAGLIKAAVGRQREWLADASAVQFTRQSDGLAGALRKIAGLPAGSTLADERSAKEVSHMLFGEGRRFSRLFSTHPPLHERIAALDPTFHESDVDELPEAPRALRPDVAGFAPTVTAPVAVTPAQVSDRVGTLTPADLDHGAALHSQLPPHIHQLALQPSTAVSVVLAMLVSAEPALRATQLAAVHERLGIDTARSVDALVGEAAAVAPHLRLPVVGIAAPQLTGRPHREQAALLAVFDDLVLADGAVSLFEYCLTRTVRATLQDAADPAARSRPGRVPVQRAMAEIATVLTALALAGNVDPAAARRAYEAAFAHLQTGTTAPAMAVGGTWRQLDACWPALDGLARSEKRMLVEALVIAVLDDGRLGTQEAELLRAACALVHVPLPALVA